MASNFCLRKGSYHAVPHLGCSIAWWRDGHCLNRNFSCDPGAVRGWGGFLWRYPNIGQSNMTYPSFCVSQGFQFISHFSRIYSRCAERVGIWFSIAVVSPGDICPDSSVCLGLGGGYVFFLLEIVAGYIYFYTTELLQSST